MRKKPTYYRVVDRDWFGPALSGFTKKDIDQLRRKGANIRITGVKKYGDRIYKKVPR